jgi:hypothetical protein
MSLSPEAVASFADLVTRELGEGVASTDPALILKCSSDWSKMSPILQEKLPPGRFPADLVVRPTSTEQVPAFLRLAYEHDVPVVPRGAGTGNYGQATPFTGGAVLDLRGLDRVLEVGDGFVTAQAGARLTVVDEAVRATGQDLWMFPSTKGSSLGGFVAGGSAGTGTVEHGTTADGFVRGMTIAPCDGSATDFRVEGRGTLPYVHTYGVTGVATELTVRTDPAREWVALYASFADYGQAVAVHRTLADLPVLPRLASLDEPGLVATLPAPVELDATRTSLRVILEVSTVDEVRRRIVAAGGEVVAVYEDYAETDRLSSMSYNHPVYFLQQSGYPCFHLEVGGRALWDAPDLVRTVYPNAMVHLELRTQGPLGMYVADYSSEAQVLAGFEALEALGVGIHSPHQWMVDRHVAEALVTAPVTDPKGLLNQLKLDRDGAAPARVDTRNEVLVARTPAS